MEIAISAASMRVEDATPGTPATEEKKRGEEGLL